MFSEYCWFKYKTKVVMQRTGWKLKKALEENCRNIFPERIKVELGVHGKHVPCVPLENSPKKVGALIGFKSCFY